jgi:hypothetical protein
MKIEIIKCSFPYAWYSDKIGNTYTVQDIGGETGDSYGVAIDSLHKFWYIHMKDCKIIEP